MLFTASRFQVSSHLQVTLRYACCGVVPTRAGPGSNGADFLKRYISTRPTHHQKHRTSNSSFSPSSRLHARHFIGRGGYVFYSTKLTEQGRHLEEEEVTAKCSTTEEQDIMLQDAYDNDPDMVAALTEEEKQELTNGDPQLLKKINYIQLEVSVLRQEGHQVPSKIKFKNWIELLPLDTRSRRKKYYLYLFKNEMKDLSVKRKMERKKEERLMDYAANPMPSKEEDIYGMFYNLHRNCLFLRLYETTINRVYHNRVCSAILHNPPLILDCSYDDVMNPREAKNCAKQLEMVFSENRTCIEPYNLWLCNATRESKLMKYLRTMIPILDDDNFVINVHEGSFMDLFPREKLVYLTPHTRDDLEEYNEDDIYIIGAMVDKSDTRPHSFAKAKKLGLRMRKLPLDEHLVWGTGNKSLTINQMMKIMLDLRLSRGDWKAAFQCVPMRKLNRDFHPYPDQIPEGQTDEGFNSPSYRKEKKSLVLEDYELMNRRKGFRRSDMVPQRTSGVIRAPKIRSLLHDE